MIKFKTARSRRGRCARACDICKRRKEKCDGIHPCGLCAERGKSHECRYSGNPRTVRPLAKRPSPRRMVHSDNLTLSPEQEQEQGNPTVDHLLSPLEDESITTLETLSGGQDAAPVPKVARLLRDGRGRLMYIGDSASLSFLQSVRRIVMRSVGQCSFTADRLRYSILDTVPAVPSHGGEIDLNREQAEQFVDQYLLATSGLLDLFRPEQFHRDVRSWIQNGASDHVQNSPLFYLVLAIGSQESSPNNDQQLAERLFSRGRQLAFNECTETPSLLTIQSYILISMYMLGACRRNGAFMNLGTAIRAAYALGIHRRSTNRLFRDEECRLREGIWKSLRVMDLFLSASLGRPAATSDFEYDPPQISDGLIQIEHLFGPPEQFSRAVVDLCRIFEIILRDVYKNQVISTQTAEAISKQYRSWALDLPAELKINPAEDAENQETRRSLREILASSHVIGAYYWSIILLTRPFLTFYVSSQTDGTRPNGIGPDNLAQISVFADACVHSALQSLEIADHLLHHPSLPKRLPFMLNTVFNAVLVIGVAFFANYHHVYPLHEAMLTAERFLSLCSPHDPHAARFAEITRYLRGAVDTYVQQRKKAVMQQRRESVSRLFGQIDKSTSSRELPLEARSEAADHSMSALTLTTTGIPVGEFGHPPLDLSFFNGGVDENVFGPNLGGDALAFAVDDLPMFATWGGPEC